MELCIGKGLVGIGISGLEVWLWIIAVFPLRSKLKGYLDFYH